MGANIMLDGTMLGSASDVNGSYLITNVPIGSYTIRAMFIGYETFEKEFRVEADKQYIIDLALKPSAIKLDETKVTAEKRKDKITGAPASMEIVTSRDIRGKNTTNMGAYLKGLKGIDFTSSGINNYSISVRGFNSSFNTRLLTLSDGRVANIPALRVINYSTIPQSMDDVDKIEVILGPATALYGANAHSGVVNIISKPPSQSEGLSMSLSGSNDERQLRKINGRFSKKLSKTFSMKISGLYLHAYDWPFIAEGEYKSHRYPWSLTPGRTRDGKDNNPWNVSGDVVTKQKNADGDWVRIGNGEQDHGDWDGDGVAGEDWWNGYDDDGDCLGDTNQDGCYCCRGDTGVDEDYFTANGIDDDGDGEIDEDIDMVHDFGYDGVDNDNNGIIDDEAGSGVIDGNIKAWGLNIETKILVNQGRLYEEFIDKQPNPYYIDGVDETNYHIFGDHQYIEENIEIVFDIYNYDFGIDGLPGDPFIDVAGDGSLQIGECTGLGGSSGVNASFDPFGNCDRGLDGVPDTDDFGEQDGIWQPGDGWIDNGNGQIDETCIGGVNCDGYAYQVTEPDENSFNDVWPLKNKIYDEGESISDCGNDGACWGDTNGDGLVNNSDNSDGWVIGEPHNVVNIYGDSLWIYGPDPGENDGLYAYDFGENDGIFDTGDKIYGFQGEDWTDCNDDQTICEGDADWNNETMGNDRWDSGESFSDKNGDNRYTPADLTDNYQSVMDTDGDGLIDYPDFEIDNRKVEFRLDFDPNPDFNMTLQSGYSWTKTQQVTGTGRYIADGFEYKFYQLRGRYKNWFSQFYMNQSFSGNTRGYDLGNRIIDKSKNYAYQIQHNSDIPFINTKFVWGMDYFTTDPHTNGTILNDGPNGYDNDGDNVYITNDSLDNDLDGIPDDLICPDGEGEGFRYGKYWQCGEGIDEPDEFIDPVSNEFGIYYQSTTELFGTSRFELITAARFDHHDLLDEGILFAPKIGLIIKPDSKSSMRFTYGKAHNTPNSITLFTDLFIGSVSLFDIYLRGNNDGTAYCRVGEHCFGAENYSTIVEPGFYSKDGNTFYNMGTLDNPDYFTGYNERVNGAPYFYKAHVDGSILSGDMVPLDTSIYVIFVPELNDVGVLYTPEESFNLPDIDPIRTEKIQTIEFGYKGFMGYKTHFSLDAYVSYYEDFFSPPTFITPWIVNRKFDNNGNDITTVDNFGTPAGLMPINDLGTHPPYGTAWNGFDDDGDWEEWADEFGWWDDKNNDGNPADPGEWGIVMTNAGEWNDVKYDKGQIFHPHEVLVEKDGYPAWKTSFTDLIAGKWDAVGVDEVHSTAGLAEYEPVQTTLIGKDEKPIIGYGNASNITDIVLSPMNYGEVWMQGVDFGITHFLSEKLIVDGNVSWYGTTEFYNELTKRNDPINAPEWKWNASIKWNSSLGDLIVNFRHVDRFVWKDGFWAGIIGPYNILDLYYTYQFTKHLDFNISALNLNNDLHKELIGGAIMGRQIIMRFTSTF